MARTNFSFKKRQQELDRKKKQEEKRQRKLSKKDGGSSETPDAGDTDATLPGEPEAGGEA